MSDEPTQSGQVSSTPEGGPIAEGIPASEPGAGQVQSTPEAAPLAEGEALIPPTWHEHMEGPILGMDDAPPAPPPASAPAATRQETSGKDREPAPARSDEERAELRKWPPYSGKPVSEVRWDALRYAAPIVAQAEKITIKAIDLSGRGLSKFARYLETRRQERDAEQRREGQSDR